MTAVLTTSPARAGHVDGLRRMYRDAGVTLSSLGSLGDGSMIEEEQCNGDSMSKDRTERLKTRNGHEHSILEERSRKAEGDVKTKTERASNAKAETRQNTITYPNLAPLTDADRATDRDNGPLANDSPARHHVHNHQNLTLTPTIKRPQIITRNNYSRSSSRLARQQSGIAEYSHQDQNPNRAHDNHTANVLIQAIPTANRTHPDRSFSPPSRLPVVYNNIPAPRASPQLPPQQARPATVLTPPQLHRTSMTHHVHNTYPVYSNPATLITPQTRNSRASRFTPARIADISTLKYNPPKLYHEAENYAEKEEKKMVLRQRDGGAEEEEEEEEEEENKDALKELSPNVEIYRKGRARRRGRRTSVFDEEEKCNSRIGQGADCDNVFGIPFCNGDGRERGWCY